VLLLALVAVLVWLSVVVHLIPLLLLALVAVLPIPLLRVLSGAYFPGSVVAFCVCALVLSLLCLLSDHPPAFLLEEEKYHHLRPLGRCLGFQKHSEMSQCLAAMEEYLFHWREVHLLQVVEIAEKPEEFLLLAE
tara:strand:+ start:80 stop:481 length:402 start_codon:yes stop_codon:yes gene_type:complete